MMRSTFRLFLIMLVGLALGAGVSLAQADPDPTGTRTGDDTRLVPGSPQIGLETPQIAPAFIFDQCVEERSIFNGYVSQGVNCTANDVTFVNVGRGVEGDACVNLSDEADVFIRTVVANTTAQNRYDIGIFIATSADDTPLDGAQTGSTIGSCAISRIPNPSNPAVLTCGDVDAGGDPPAQPGINYLDLLGTSYDEVDPPEVDGSAGYYATFDGTAQGGASAYDWCSDLIDDAGTCDENDDGVMDETTIDFTNPVTIACDDVDGDGFLNIASCVTWGQVNVEVSGGDGDNFCESSWDVGAGAPSKCNCAPAASDIPAPNLACQEPAPGVGNNILCTYNGQDVTGLPTVPAGGVVQCSVRVTNSLPLLAADPCVDEPLDPNSIFDAERWRCGHIGYVQWAVAVTPSSGTLPTISNNATSTDVEDSLSLSVNTLVWRTRSDSTEVIDPGFTGTLGVIRPNEETTLTFEFTVPEGDPGRTFDISMDGFWSNAPDFSAPVQQGVLSCSSNLTATPVTLASARVRGFGGEQTLEWTTATETTNVGFNVLAETADGLVQVNGDLIESRAIDSTSPQSYQLDVSGVGSGRFWIEEVDVKGKTQRHGPYRLGRSYGRAPEVERIDWGPARELTAPRADRRGVRVAATAKGGNRQAGAGEADLVALQVREDGVYRVSYEDLAAAGLDLSGVQASALALTRQSQPVPIRVLGANRFGPGSAVEFFGEGIDSLYTEDNLYVLSNDRKAALRIGEEPGTPTEAPQPFVMATAVRDHDLQYSFTSPTDDPWFEGRLLARGSAVSGAYEFMVDDLVPGGPAATLAVDVWGQSEWPADPDHHVVISVNGVQVADARWDGVVGQVIEAAIPDGVLQSGANTVTVTVPGDNGSPWDLVNFDRFEVRYPSAPQVRDGELLFTAEGGAYNVGGVAGDFAVYRVDGAGVVLLTGLQASGGQVSFATTPGARYAVVTGAVDGVAGIAAARAPQDLAAGRADYLIVSHSSFISGLAPLVSFHEARGLAVQVVDVEDVYASYTGGVVGPQAIRDFVRDAAAEMGIQYVLLVGADSYDYKDNLGLGSVSFVPTPYMKTDWLITFSPVDPLYGDVDGDMVPDLPVGRFPVRTLDELDAVIGKTLDYDAKLYGRTAVIAADQTDSAGVSFTSDASRFNGELRGFTTQEAYVDQLGTAGARSRITEAIDGGSALTVYFGHSGPTAWGSSGLFSASDAAGLTNYGKPTVVVQWGCWNTYHVEPRFNTLGHAFLVERDRGAAAVLGSATLLSTRSEGLLAPRLASKLAQGGLSIGQAVTLAKQELAAQNGNRLDVILGWTILGDPALTVAD